MCVAELMHAPVRRGSCTFWHKRASARLQSPISSDRFFGCNCDGACTGDVVAWNIDIDAGSVDDVSLDVS